jgi:hypothetical protein
MLWWQAIRLTWCEIKVRGLSPQANYTNRATAGRWS